jgi:hypothetical protein
MNTMQDLDVARDDVAASSAGGAPFLLAFGATILIAGLVAPFVTIGTATMILLFQGNVALPLAFWLERRLARGRMSPDNPLKSLSVQLAMTQIVALPAVIIVAYLAPWAVPAAFAAIGGGHFLPYSWLHRTPLYWMLGVVVSLGASCITAILGQQAFSPVLLYLATCYWVAAGILLRTRMTRAALAS